MEPVIRLLKDPPVNLLRLLFWLLKSRAAFKDVVASHTRLAAEKLPYHERFLAYLLDEKENGRRIILATAAHGSIAESVAAHLGLFDGVVATNAVRNLKGRTKLEAIREKVGEAFVYAGDSQADFVIWKAAKAAVLVGVSSSSTKSISREVPIEKEFPKEVAGFTTWLRALRVHSMAQEFAAFCAVADGLFVHRYFKVGD